MPHQSAMESTARLGKTPQCLLGVERLRQQLARLGEERQTLRRRALDLVEPRPGERVGRLLTGGERNARSSSSKVWRSGKLSETAPNASLPTASGITASEAKRTELASSAGNRWTSSSADVVHTASLVRIATDIGRSAASGKRSHPERPGFE